MAQRFMAEVAATVQAAEILVAGLSAVEIPAVEIPAAGIPAAEIREASQAALVPALALATVLDRTRASGEFLPERARIQKLVIPGDGQMPLRAFAWGVPRARQLVLARCPLKPD